MRRAKPIRLLLTLVAVACAGEPQEEQQRETLGSPQIAIIYTAPHPVINDIIEGFKAVVTRTFPEANFHEDHAQGDDDLYSEAVLRGLRRRPDLLAPITTPITQITVQEARGRTPVVFMGVTDPVGAGVAESIQRPQIATGSSDLCPFGPLLEVTRALFPNARTIGLPYNPGDQPAVFGRSQLMGLASEYDFEIIDRQVSSPVELATVVGGLARRVDVVLIAADNLMMENPSLVVSSAAERGTPTVACDEASVQAGAVAGVSVTYRQVGEAAGERAVKVLQGTDPGTLAIGVLSSGARLVNKEAACRAGANVQSELMSDARVINPDYVCSQESVPPDRAGSGPRT